MKGRKDVARRSSPSSSPKGTSELGKVRAAINDVSGELEVKDFSWSQGR